MIQQNRKKCFKRSWRFDKLTLNYLDKFWDNIFAFLKDGDLPIDNNLAERAIRPLTTQRNSMLHFGSDEGAEMAATYHSIISTVKMQGRSAWEYLGKFFTKSLIKRIESSSLEYLSVKTLSNVFNGCKDFFSLRPDKFSCQRVQSQTCLSYAECSRKSWNKSDRQYANIFDKWEQ